MLGSLGEARLFRRSWLSCHVPTFHRSGRIILVCGVGWRFGWHVSHAAPHLGEAGAMADKADMDGRTPLHLAAGRGGFFYHTIGWDLRFYSDDQRQARGK